MDYISPYVDGLLGLSYLYTETKIEDIDNYKEVASSTNFDDITVSYGVGAGIKFKVYETLMSAVSLMKVYVDLKVHYSSGGKAEYLKEGSVGIENGKVYYDITKSKTDLMLYQIGVVVGF